MESVIVRWKHDAKAEVVEQEVPLACPPLKTQHEWRDEQMDLLGIEDRDRFHTVQTAREALFYAICRQDSGKGGFAEIVDPKTKRVLFASPRARAKELGAQWVGPLQ